MYWLPQELFLRQIHINRLSAAVHASKPRLFERQQQFERKVHVWSRLQELCLTCLIGFQENTARHLQH